MIPTASLLVALAGAVGVYLVFFEGPQELIEQFLVSFLGGGQRDYRVFLLVSVPLALGLLTYVLLLRFAGRPVTLPFL